MSGNLFTWLCALVGGFLIGVGWSIVFRALFGTSRVSGVWRDVFRVIDVHTQRVLRMERNPTRTAEAQALRDLHRDLESIRSGDLVLTQKDDWELVATSEVVRAVRG